MQPAYDIGFRADEIMLDWIEGTESPPMTVRLPASLKVTRVVRGRGGEIVIFA